MIPRIPLTIYDRIYDIAAESCGLVTSAEAKKVGASDKELSRLTSEGRLTCIGRGVYRVKHHVSEPFDQYAEAVALVGPKAYLFGEFMTSVPQCRNLLLIMDSQIRATMPIWHRKSISRKWHHVQTTCNRSFAMVRYVNSI